MSTTDTLAAMRDWTERAIETLDALTDDERCSFDHNKNCQSHGTFRYDGTCRNQDAIELLAERDPVRAALQEAIDALALAERYKAEPMLYRCRWYSGPNVVKVIAYDEQAVMEWLDGKGYIDLVESLTGNRITYLPPGWNRQDADKAFEALEGRNGE